MTKLADTEGASSSGHTLWCRGPYIWCSTCYAYSTRRMQQLAQTCRGHPHTRGRTHIKDMEEGFHPTRPKGTPRVPYPSDMPRPVRLYVQGRVCSLTEPSPIAIDPNFLPDLVDLSTDDALSQVEEANQSNTQSGAEETYGTRESDDVITLPDSCQRFIMQNFLE